MSPSDSELKEAREEFYFFEEQFRKYLDLWEKIPMDLTKDFRAVVNSARTFDELRKPNLWEMWPEGVMETLSIHNCFAQLEMSMQPIFTGLAAKIFSYEAEKRTKQLEGKTSAEMRLRPDETEAQILARQVNEVLSSVAKQIYCDENLTTYVLRINDLLKQKEELYFYKLRVSALLQVPELFPLMRYYTLSKALHILYVDSAETSKMSLVDKGIRAPTKWDILDGISINESIDQEITHENKSAAQPGQSRHGKHNYKGPKGKVTKPKRNR